MNSFVMLWLCFLIQIQGGTCSSAASGRVTEPRPMVVGRVTEPRPNPIMEAPACSVR